MIYETKIIGGKLGDCLLIPHRDNSIKDYSGTIAKTDEELAHTFGIYTKEYLQKLDNRQVVLNNVSIDKKDLANKINSITDKDKDYNLVTSIDGKYIIWGIKERLDKQLFWYIIGTQESEVYMSEEKECNQVLKGLCNSAFINLKEGLSKILKGQFMSCFYVGGGQR